MNYSVFSAEELVKACAESENAEAWAEFMRRFHKRIGSAVWRIAQRWGETNTSIIDDLIQDTYFKLCANDCRLLRDFEPERPDAFVGMLMVTASNVARDYFRNRHSAKRGSGLTECELTEAESFVSDSHSASMVRIEREIQLQEVDKILTSIFTPTASRDREIFWLYYRQGFSAKAIASIACYELTTKGVESTLFRLTRLVRESLVEKGAESHWPADRAKGICLPNTLIKGEGQS